MDNAFEFLINIIVGQINGVLWIWALVGIVIACVGLIPIAIGLLMMVLGKRVTLKVAVLHEEARKVKEDDDAERIAEKKARPNIRAEFEVMDGPHKGTRQKSGSASNHPIHSLGDIVPGYYTPIKGGEAMSAAEIRRAFKMGLIFIVIGLGVILFINYVFGEVNA